MGGGGGSAPTIPDTVPVRASTSTPQHRHVTDSILRSNPFSFGQLQGYSEDFCWRKSQKSEAEKDVFAPKTPVY